ncbi:MAG: hypothetical protein HY722_15300 [Planctomycetes bacterium]|nr:hypothetical protein [Planctomycetota bacterium]
MSGRASAWLLAAAALAVAGLLGVVRVLGPERERDRWVDEGWRILRGKGGGAEAALWAFERAEAATPGDPQVAHGVARALAALGRHAESMDAYSRAAAAGVLEHSRWREGLWRGASTGDLNWGFHVSAETFLTTLAEEAARAGDTATATRASGEALRRLEAAGHAAPATDPSALVRLARLRLAAGEGEAAREALSRALDALPDGRLPQAVAVQLPHFLDRVGDPALVERVLEALGREDADSGDLSPDEIQRRVLEALQR